MASLVLILVAASPTGLQLGQIGTIEGCPMWQQLPVALQQVMPKLPVGTKRGRGDLQVDLRPIAGGARLALTDRRRGAVLQRDVPVPHGACRAAADGIALIIERYLTDIGWTPSAASLPAWSPEPDSSWAPDGLHLAVRGRAELAAEPTRTRWGGGVAARVPFGSLEAVLQLSGTTPESQVVRYQDDRRGRIWAFGVDAVLSGGACWRPSSRVLCADVGAGAEMVRGSIRGLYLYRETKTTAWQPLLRFELRFEQLIGRALGLSLATVVDARPSQAGFEVQGATSNYRTPAWAAAMQVGIWWLVF